MNKNQLFTLIMSFVFASSLFAQTKSNHDLTLAKQINSQSVKQVIWEGDIIHKMHYWKKDYIRVEINISSKSHKPQILKALAQAGRYFVQSKKEAQKLVLNMPNINEEISINNLHFKDLVFIQIYLPDQIELIETNLENMVTYNSISNE